MTKNIQDEKNDSVDPDHGFWTIPNFLCLFRIIGSIALLPIAKADLPLWFVGAYLVLIFTDLIDGPIARRFHMRSDMGARMDTIADLTLNACMVLGVLTLRWDVLLDEIHLLSGVLFCYAASTVFGLIKFRRMLAYHTYLGKTTQWLAMVAAVSLVLEWSIWPFRIAAIASILGNLEATAITFVLRKWQADVLSFFLVWPEKKVNRS